MTFAYALNFVAFFGLWPVGVFAVPVLLGLYVPLGLHHGAAAWAGVAGALLALVLYMYFVIHHTSRLRIRSGAPPLLLNFRTPSSSAELETEVKKIGVTNVHVVNGGWGMFLQRRGADPSRRVYMSSLVGRAMPGSLERVTSAEDERGVENTSKGVVTTWLAGTPLAHINSYLQKKHDCTLPHVPTMQYIGVGSWAATFSHGNEGPDNTESVILAVYVASRPGKIPYAGYCKMCGADILNRMTKPPYDLRARNHVVVAVEVASIRNDLVQKSLTLVYDEEDMRTWLDKNACLRLMFFGSSRSYKLGLAWERTGIDWKKAKHKDPHTGSTIGPFFQADIFSVRCGCCLESPQNWTGVSTMETANNWVPWLSPFETVFTIISGYVNTEYVFKLKSAEVAATWEFAHDAHDIFLHHATGRGELRRPKNQGPNSTLVYFDTVVREGWFFKFDFARFARLLEKHAADGKFALHPGKAHTQALSAHRRLSEGDAVLYGLELVSIDQLVDYQSTTSA
jgi:hypothetical protein